MPQVFEPYDFCGIELKNRFVRSPTSENLAALDRGPSVQLVKLYEELARGEVGLIITSGTRADRTWEWGAQGKNMCIDRDELIPAFASLTDRVHSFDSKIAL